MQLAYPPGMTNGSPRQTRRRENLRSLIDQNGGQAQVALEIGTPKSHLSAILAGRRGVGDALAQKIEQHFALPPGWMDSSDAEGLPPDVSGMLAEMNTLPPKWRDWVILNLRESLKLAHEMVTEGAVTHVEHAATQQIVPDSPKRRSHG
jgi:hypothetical protein